MLIVRQQTYRQRRVLLTEDPPLLRVENLAKHFSTHGTISKAVDGISFHIADGETLALVGESGCGKSTTARCLVRLTDPDSGQIFFRGRDIAALSARAFLPMRRHVQMVFQDPHSSLNPRFTVRRVLLEPLKRYRADSESDINSDLSKLMSSVRLHQRLLHSRPHQLSGGQKQRVAIARAIATNPGLVILDEPTSALDMSLRRSLLDLLRDLQERLGMTYLFIAHDFSTVRYLANRVIVMYLGKIMEEGPVAKVLDEPRHPYTQALVSAVPIPDPHVRRDRLVLVGTDGAPSGVDVGCRFQYRCPFVTEPCRQADVPFFDVDGSQVACLLYQ